MIAAGRVTVGGPRKAGDAIHCRQTAVGNGRAAWVEDRPLELTRSGVRLGRDRGRIRQNKEQEGESAPPKRQASKGPSMKGIRFQRGWPDDTIRPYAAAFAVAGRSRYGFNLAVTEAGVV